VQTFSFTLVLDETDISDEMANDLYGGGCDDAILARQGGEVTLDFDREAEDEQSAIDSAIENVRKAGYSIRFVR